VLIHADIGVGKTTLIGSGGKEYKILLIRPPVDHTDPIIGSGVKEMIIKSHEELAEALDYLQHEGNKWDWVFVDSISLLQDIGLDDVYEGMLDTKGPPGSLARKIRAQFGPDRGEYRVNMWRLEQFIRHAVGAQLFNFGVMAHSFWYEPQDESVPPALWPWIQGKAMPQKICGMMNVVGYMAVKEKEVKGEKQTSRILYTNKTESWYAKNQFKMRNARGGFSVDGPGVFGEKGEIINPTLPKIVKMIEKGRLVTKGEGSVKPVRRKTRRER